MPRRRVAGVWFVVLLSLVAEGCGGADGPKVTETRAKSNATTTTRPSSGSKAAVAYFEAFGTGDPDAMQGMLENSFPGSPASAYAIHQIAYAIATRDAGIQTAPNWRVRLEVGADSIKACVSASRPGTEEVKPQGCTVTSALVTDKKTKKLVSFSEDGIPQAGLVIVGSGRTQSGLGVGGPFHICDANTF